MQQIAIRQGLAALTLILASASAHADFGYANSQCSRWLDPELAGEEVARRQWVLGYLSAAARFGEKDLTYMDPNDALVRLRDHCAQHPTDSLETAVLKTVLSDE